VNFSPALSDSNYAVTCMTNSDASRDLTIRSNNTDGANPDTQSTTQLRLHGTATSGSGIDLGTNCIAVFR